MMSGGAHVPGELFIASGDPARPRLYRYTQTEGRWTGHILHAAENLTCLAWHPTEPIIYATAGVQSAGHLLAWRIDDCRATALATAETKGTLPCHLATHPSGRFLVVKNYGSGNLAVQMLGPDGKFQAPAEATPFAGRGPDNDRQDGPHPHHAVFADNMLHVVDLGADLVRHFGLDLTRSGAAILVPDGETQVPPGTGPRHLRIAPDGALILSGELSSTVLRLRQGWRVDDCQSELSTALSGPREGTGRNHPGDIQVSADGKQAYCANRGNDTIAVLALDGGRLRLCAEEPAGVAWPQHLLLLDDALLVAGRDSSAVSLLPLRGGLPGAPEKLFTCPRPAWLLPPQGLSQA